MKKAISATLGTLIRLLPLDVLKRGLDAFLDVIEEEVASSPNKIDDLVVLPLCKVIRGALGVEDNDE